MTFEEFSFKFNLNLNPQQAEAVKSIDGPVLLLAVPGSGKTTVLTARSAYMIYCAEIDPKSIVNLTYSKAAALEMKSRFLKKYELSENQAPRFSTIHSFCCSAISICEKLKHEHIPTLDPKYDAVIHKVLISLMPEYPTDNDVANAERVIGFIKNKMLKEKDYPEVDIDGVSTKKLYNSYIREMQSQDKMDYDDQLLMAYYFFQKYPDILRMFQERYRYFCIDEAQDTSLIQHKIIRLLAAKSRNLFMVGDDDQSIYGFRGAFPRALLNFGIEYPDAKILTMSTNYRSDTDIIAAANLFIRQNKDRYNKTIIPYSRNEGVVAARSFGDYKNQPEFLLERVISYLTKPNQTLAILYRNNESAFPILTTLMKNGIFVKYRDDSKLFFSHFVVEDILAFLRLALNPNDIDAFEKIWYKLGMYWKKETYYRIQSLVRNDGVYLFEAIRIICPEKAPKIDKMERTLQEMSRATPLSAIYSILSDLKYMDYIKDKEERGNQGAMSKVFTLQAIAAQFNTIREFFDNLEKLLTYKSYASNITLSTIHSCKGLEFDHVIIVDLFNGILPSADAKKSNEIAEEDRRLFYVGITRAKHILELVAASSVFGNIKAKSPYIQQCFKKPDAVTKTVVNLPSALTESFKQPTNAQPKPDIKAGTRIVHNKFGSGIVISVTPTGILEVAFQDPPITKKLGLETCIQQKLIQIE